MGEDLKSELSVYSEQKIQGDKEYSMNIAISQGKALCRLGTKVYGVDSKGTYYYVSSSLDRNQVWHDTRQNLNLSSIDRVVQPEERGDDFANAHDMIKRKVIEKSISQGYTLFKREVVDDAGRVYVQMIGLNGKGQEYVVSRVLKTHYHRETFWLKTWDEMTPGNYKEDDKSSMD